MVTAKWCNASMHKQSALLVQLYLYVGSSSYAYNECVFDSLITTVVYVSDKYAHFIMRRSDSERRIITDPGGVSGGTFDLSC